MESCFFSESEVRESVNEFVLKQLYFPPSMQGGRGGSGFESGSLAAWKLGGFKAVIVHLLPSRTLPKEKCPVDSFLERFRWGGKINHPLSLSPIRGRSRLPSP